MAVKWNIDPSEFRVVNPDRTFTNHGMLEKVWVENKVNGKLYLAKGTKGHGYEPIAEAMAYRIGASLGLMVAPSYVVKKGAIEGLNIYTKCGYISLTENVASKDWIVTDIVKEKELRIAAGLEPGFVSDKEIMARIMKKEWIARIIFLDALLCQKDRHFRNVHVLKNIKTGEYAECPILDNGDCLMATDLVCCAALADKIDYSKFLAPTHEEETRYYRTFDLRHSDSADSARAQIWNVHDLLPLLGKRRAHEVEKFIRMRFAGFYPLYGGT